MGHILQVQGLISILTIFLEEKFDINCKNASIGGFIYSVLIHCPLGLYSQRVKNSYRNISQSPICLVVCLNNCFVVKVARRLGNVAVEAPAMCSKE